MKRLAGLKTKDCFIKIVSKINLWELRSVKTQVELTLCDEFVSMFDPIVNHFQISNFVANFAAAKLRRKKTTFFLHITFSWSFRISLVWIWLTKRVLTTLLWICKSQRTNLNISLFLLFWIFTHFSLSPVPKQICIMVYLALQQLVKKKKLVWIYVQMYSR